MTTQSAAHTLCVAALLSGPGCYKPNADESATRILLDSTSPAHGRAPTVLGEPIVTQLEPGPALCFDGVDDGLIFDENPLAGRAAFTIEVLFRPDAAGPAAQRFVHIQEQGSENRAMIETRVAGDTFYLDTFLASRGTKATLAEPTLSHRAASFHWAALSYADGHMRQFMDGVPELEAALLFAPLGAGQMSLGVRLNRRYWFKGCIREIRISPRALPADQLQTLPAR